MSGLLFMIDTPPTARPNLEIEMYDGQSDSWKPLPREERIDQLDFGHYVDTRGYTFQTHGVVYWGTAPWLWTLRTPTTSFPEAGTPPTTEPKFWVRVRNVGTVDLPISRVLPVLYNTYASVEDVARFMGVSDFNEIQDPLLTLVKNRIRAAEDWIDQYTRRSWRMRMTLNERQIFNPWGVRLNHRPVRFVMRAGAWTGSAFTAMREGRAGDYYVSVDLGFIYMTRVTLGRGLPWSSVASRYLRAPESLEMDYIWGDDFDISNYRNTVQEITLMRVASELATMQDWVVMLINNPDAMPKPEKIAQWKEDVISRSDEIRGLLLA
jgi:hypothetical protein